MKKLIASFLFLCLICSQSFAQTRPDWLDVKNKPSLDFRAFGAKAVGTFDNAAALASAAAFINARGGNCELVIPPGTYYLVPGGLATPPGSRDLWSAFKLSNATGVKITFMPGARINTLLDMGSASVNGRSMYVLDFDSCTDVTIENPAITVTVTSTANPADTADGQYEFASLIHLGSDCDRFKIRGGFLQIYNPTNGNANGQGSKFNTIFLEGDSYVNPNECLLIENVIFNEGQGPVLWCWYSKKIFIQNNFWKNCGGPLNQIRMYPAPRDVFITGNMFQMKHQPGQLSALDHDYPIAIQNNIAEIPTDITITNNTFYTLGGQMVTLAGATNVNISDNKVIGSASAGTSFTGSVVLSNTNGVIISGNEFKNFNDRAVNLLNNCVNTSFSNNIIASCSYGVTAGNATPDSTKISGNHFSELTQQTIFIATPATWTKTIDIVGNSFTGVKKSAIYSISPSAMLLNITGNTFLFCGASDPTDFVVNAQNGTSNITGNYFRGNYCDSDIFLGAANNPSGGSVVANYSEGAAKNGFTITCPYSNINANTLINYSQTASGAAILVATGTPRLVVNGNNAYAVKAQYGVYIASSSQSIVVGNNLVQSGATPLATGTAGVVDSANLY